MGRKKNNCGIVIADEAYCDVLGKILYIDEEIKKASIDLLCLYNHINHICELTEVEYDKVELGVDVIDYINDMKEYVNKTLRTISHNIYLNLTDKVTEFSEMLNNDISTDYYSIKELRNRLEYLKRDCTLIYAGILDENYGTKQYTIDLANTVSDKGFDSSLIGILLSIKGVEMQILALITTISTLSIKENK